MECGEAARPASDHAATGTVSRVISVKLKVSGTPLHAHRHPGDRDPESVLWGATAEGARGSVWGGAGGSARIEGN